MKKRRREFLSAAVRLLCVDQIVIDDFCCSFPYCVHPSYPLHGFLRFKLFSDALGGSIVFDQPKEKSVGLFFNVGKVRAKLTAGLQVGIEDGMMLLEIAQPTLDPDTNGTFFFGWQFEIR